MNIDHTCPICGQHGAVARWTAPTLLGESCLICTACHGVSLARDWLSEAKP